MSGFDDFEYAKQAIQYNIISYMLKPLTMDGLAAELKAIHEKIDARYAGLRRADSAHAIAQRSSFRWYWPVMKMPPRMWRRACARQR